MNQNKFKKAKKIEQDQGKLYLQAYDLVHQALHVCIVRDVIKKYRHQRERTKQSYNIVMSISHVALEHYSIQQLWKLFDRKSVFNVYHVVEKMPHPRLKAWFKSNIKTIRDDLGNVETLRHNLVGHRPESSHITYTEFNKKFFKGIDHEEKIRDFLLNFLSQLKFEMQGEPVDKIKTGLLDEMESYKQLILKEQRAVLKTIHSDS